MPIKDVKFIWLSGIGCGTLFTYIMDRCGIDILVQGAFILFILVFGLIRLAEDGNGG